MESLKPFSFTDDDKVALKTALKKYNKANVNQFIDRLESSCDSIDLIKKNPKKINTITNDRVHAERA